VRLSRNHRAPVRKRGTEAEALSRRLCLILFSRDWAEVRFQQSGLTQA
jgi:hypothetical protein